MKISLIFCLLTTSLFCQSQDTHIKDFFNSLNNKTILIEIFENQSVFNAKISLNDPKIYFETIEVDSTVSLFENNVITSYDLSKKNIIVENSEKNILDFFSYKNFVNASLLKIEIENENSIYYYNFYNNILLISFDNSQSMVKEISLLQAENSIFECKIVDINKYQNPLKFLNIDDSWTTIDWR